MLNRARVKSLGLAFVVVGAATLAACAQSAPRNEPTPTQVAPEPTDTAVPATATPTLPPTVEPTATATAVVVAEESPTPTPTATPQATPTPTPTSTGTPTAIPVNNVQTYTLTLEIEGLGDDNIVRGDSVFARGQTSPDAVVSVNGVIVPVTATGYFEFSIKLDPGPNAIEVVASDLSGNQVSTTIAVVSLPEDLS